MYIGYYFTGDGAKRDEDGYYWITGRVDDVINPSGHRIGRVLFCFNLMYFYLFGISEVYMVCVCRSVKYCCINFRLFSETEHCSKFNIPKTHSLHKKTPSPGTAEIESALVSCAEFVSEAAVVGFPHEIKGEGIGCYVILR